MDSQKDGVGHVKMKALNVEAGSERFPISKDVYPPRTASWRNNLTALSQRRNILFTACSHQIYVWCPSGRLQLLNSTPEMIITPVLKEPRATGYISPVSPHSINHIICDDLGTEEVLLFATDSGNVSAYHVEAICSALERAAELDEPRRPLDGSDIQPFFAEYVGRSAWGLAIHKFARLIAVSANTHDITVFAFGLVDPSGHQESGADRGILEEAGEGYRDYYGQSWEVIDSSRKLHDLRLQGSRKRSRNLRLTYIGHETNIPSISFLNTDIEPNGEWMVSADIDNVMIVWSVWSLLTPYRVHGVRDINDGLLPPQFE